VSHDLTGQTALITGAGSGIGAAIAQGFAAVGARVLVTDKDEDAARLVAQAIDAPSCRLDVTQESDWAAAIEQAKAELGGLSILVCNAGAPVGGSVEDMDLSAWRHAFAVNADGAFLGIKAALPLLRDSPAASIIAVSSIAAVAARGDMAAYGASKSALLSLVKSVALHCAHHGWNIRANAILPAYVDTPMLDAIAPQMDRLELLKALSKHIPARSIAKTQDVVEAALYLASPASGFMTGAELRLDGGLSAG